MPEPRRITLDDRDDRPTGWMPDGDTLLFESNRNVSWDVFRQRLEMASAEQVAMGHDEQFGAQSAPDGKAVLYWSISNGASEMRLVSVPAEGGPAREVMRAPPRSEFRCASACILAEFDEQKASLSRFDWQSGTRGPRQELQLRRAPNERVYWALSPDAAAVAVTADGGVRVIKIGSSEIWAATAAWFTGKLTGVAFRGDSSQLVVTTTSARENLVLLVKKTGAKKLWASPRKVALPVVSLDGKHLLMTITTESSNAWLVEDF